MQSGTILGERYTLGERLGTGRDGSVWTGHDSIFDRDVTIKILAAELAEDETVRERFRHVALRVATLAVPGIVDVHDCLEEPDPDGGMLVCHITQRVPGRSLRELLAETGAMPPPRALSLVAEVARTLDAAHREGVVHGNLKPENLMVTDAGSVTIVDFGFQVPKPSPYTAPELTADSPAADVYGLGAVVYECLTGAAPAANGDISPLLNDFEPADAAPIMKAMSPQANHRFASAAAFADACLHIEPALADGEEFDPIALASTFAAEYAAVKAVAEPSIQAEDHADTEPADEPDREPAEAANPDTSAGDGDASTRDDAAEAASTTAGPAAADTSSPEDGPEAAKTTAGLAAAESAPDPAATVEPSDDDPDEELTEPAEAEPSDGPRPSLRNQALVIGVLLAVIALVAGIMHFAVPGQPTGSQPDDQPSSETSASESGNPSPTTTDVHGSPNPAEPAPTSSSPSPSDAPTSGDDNDDGVQIPYVVGMRVESAQTELSNKGFLVIVSEEGEGRQQCRVHDQSPGGGESAPGGSTVTISVRRVDNPQQCIDPTS